MRLGFIDAVYWEDSVLKGETIRNRLKVLSLILFYSNLSEKQSDRSLHGGGEDLRRVLKNGRILKTF